MRSNAMQVTETTTEGLKREFRVVVPAADLEARLNERIVELKDRVRLNGFRPGKVPINHLKRVYGRAVMAEAIEAVVRETNAQIVSDRGFRLAMEPKVTLPEEQSEIEGVITGHSDLSYTVAVEVIPTIELADFKTITIDRLVTEVTDEEVAEAIKTIADQNKPFAAKAEGVAAQGDRVIISFTGTIDGEPFEGGNGEDIAVLIGSGTFIPGFEEQLIGIGAGQTRTVNASFPSNYSVETLAGKNAAFEVTAKAVEAPGSVEIDDAFAKSLGIESLDNLKTTVKERLEREHAAVSRQKLKRTLLDKLDELHKFAPPPTLVEEEFDRVWNTVLSDLKSQNRTFDDEGTTEEKAKLEYRAIADRRVRLGLVIAEIGEKNGIKVTEEELSRAVVERARQFPGREQEVWEYYRKNPSAVGALRAPIFEEKVVDFVVELAVVTDKPVPREELYKEDDDLAAESLASSPA
jgi:trigger factor